MKLIVLCGQDDVAKEARRSKLIDELNIDVFGLERIDMRDDDASAMLQSAIESPSLFGPARQLDVIAFDKLDDSCAKELVRLSERSDCVIIARADGVLRPKLKRALAPIAEIETFTAARGHAVVGRVQEIATAYGITLTGELARLIADRSGEQLSRVRSVMAHCASVNLVNPDRRQIETLLGSMTASLAPWAVSDALEGASVSDVIAVAAKSKAEPFPVLGYLRNRYGLVARIVEGGMTRKDVQEKLGIDGRRGDSLYTLAKRLSVPDCHAVWGELSAIEQGLRSSDNNAWERGLLRISRSVGTRSSERSAAYAQV